MRKTIQKEVDICDSCNKDDYVNRCIGCGKDFCWKCEKDGKLIKYPHAVYFSGSGDGYFCPACIEKPPTERVETILNTYRKISILRTEEKCWYDDFKVRCNKAEAELKSLLGK